MLFEVSATMCVIKKFWIGKLRREKTMFFHIFNQNLCRKKATIFVKKIDPKNSTWQANITIWALKI